MPIKNSTFDEIKKIVSDLFEAPDHQVDVWINENEKRFLLIDKNPMSDLDIIYDTIGLYFCKETWPGEERKKSFLKKLSKKSSLYGWKLKV
jgi:hypothetical protein